MQRRCVYLWSRTSTNGVYVARYPICWFANLQNFLGRERSETRLSNVHRLEQFSMSKSINVVFMSYVPSKVSY